eukprot:346093_1
MAQHNAPEWFYNKVRSGGNSYGITLNELKQILHKDDFNNNIKIWHPTLVPQWSQLKLLPKNIQKLLNINYEKEHSKSDSYSYNIKSTKRKKNERKRKRKHSELEIELLLHDNNGWVGKRKNSDSFDISTIAPLSEFTLNFTNDNKINTNDKITNDTLKQFLNNYNSIKYDKFNNKLTILKKLYNERNDKTLKIEKNYFNIEYIHKKNELNINEKFILSQINYYNNGIKKINN